MHPFHRSTFFLPDHITLPTSLKIMLHETIFLARYVANCEEIFVSYPILHPIIVPLRETRKVELSSVFETLRDKLDHSAVGCIATFSMSQSARFLRLRELSRWRQFTALFTQLNLNECTLATPSVTTHNSITLLTGHFNDTYLIK